MRHNPFYFNWCDWIVCFDGFTDIKRVHWWLYPWEYSWSIFYIAVNQLNWIMVLWTFVKNGTLSFLSIVLVRIIVIKPFQGEGIFLDNDCHLFP